MLARVHIHSSVARATLAGQGVAVYSSPRNDPRDCSFSRSREGTGISITLKHRVSPWFPRHLASPTVPDLQQGMLRFPVIETEQQRLSREKRSTASRRGSSLARFAHLSHAMYRVFELPRFGFYLLFRFANQLYGATNTRYRVYWCSKLPVALRLKLFSAGLT